MERPMAQSSVRRRSTIAQHNGNALLDRANDSRINGFGRRPNDQNVDIALKQILDVGHLLGRVVVGVGDDHLLDKVLVLLGRVLQGMQVSDRPDVRDRGVGEPDRVGRRLLEGCRVDELNRTVVPDFRARHPLGWSVFCASKTRGAKRQNRRGE